MHKVIYFAASGGEFNPKKILNAGCLPDLSGKAKTGVKRNKGHQKKKQYLKS